MEEIKQMKKILFTVLAIMFLAIIVTNCTNNSTEPTKEFRGVDYQLVNKGNDEHTKGLKAVLRNVKAKRGNETVFTEELLSELISTTDEISRREFNEELSEKVKEAVENVVLTKKGNLYILNNWECILQKTNIILNEVDDKALRDDLKFVMGTVELEFSKIDTTDIKKSTENAIRSLENRIVAHTFRSSKGRELASYSHGVLRSSSLIFEQIALSPNRGSVGWGTGFLGGLIADKVGSIIGGAIGAGITAPSGPGAVVGGAVGASSGSFLFSAAAALAIDCYNQSDAFD